MRVIEPIIVNDSVLTASSIPEPDAANSEVEWSAGSYNLNAEVIKVNTHLRYRCVADPSTTDDPEVGALANPPTWSILGATNRYAMFDNKNSTQSFDATELATTITPTTLVNSIAGFNISASTINVKVNDGASDIYDTDLSMIDNSERVNHYQYFFSPLVNITRFVLTDLPPSIGYNITLTATSGSDAKIGNVVLGQFSELGDTSIEVGVQGLDFSTRNDDGFGGFDVVKRETADLIDFNFGTSVAKLGYLKRKLKDLSQVETVWVGNEVDVNDAYTTFGYYTDYTIKSDNPSLLFTTLQVQELI